MTSAKSKLDRGHFISFKTDIEMFCHMPKLFNSMFKQDTRKAEVSLNLFLPPGTNRSRVWQKCGWLIDSKNNSRSRYLSQAILRFHVNLSSLQSVIRVLSQIHRLRLKYYRRIAWGLMWRSVSSCRKRKMQEKRLDIHGHRKAKLPGW